MITASIAARAKLAALGLKGCASAIGRPRAPIAKRENHPAAEPGEDIAGSETGPRPVTAEPAPRVVVLERAADLAPHVVSWKALADAAIEPNVFYEPCVLLPALEAFGGQRQLVLVLILGAARDATEGPNAAPVLWGFFPLERRAPGRELPIPCLVMWHHDYSYVPTPLVHRAHGAAVMTAFFDWLKTQRHAPSLLVMNKLPVGGPFHQILIEELGRRGTATLVRGRGTRASLDPDCDAATYQARALGGKPRKELRRRRRRLGELGRLDFTELTAADDLDSWIAEFLALEASGWKGREGSALGSSARDAGFFRDMTRGCRAAGKLAATAIRLDGRPVAMQVMLRSGRGAYAFKVAYDEHFARYSPGVLLALDLVDRVAGGKSVAWIDSCAAQHHAMTNSVWTERRSLESLVLAGNPAMELFVSAWPAIAWLKKTASAVKRKGWRW